MLQKPANIKFKHASDRFLLKMTAPFLLSLPGFPKGIGATHTTATHQIFRFSNNHIASATATSLFANHRKHPIMTPITTYGPPSLLWLPESAVY